MAAGNISEARRWAERAVRLLPSDDTLALTLASVCLGQDDARALYLLSRLATRHDVREVWMGLAIAQRNLRNHAAAAAAINALLRRHVPDILVRGVATTLAEQLALPGWCGVTTDGLLTVHLTDERQRALLEIGLEYRRLHANGRSRIPGQWWQQAQVLRVTCNGVDLLGSPIDAAFIRRIEGYAELRGLEIAGWAWCPSDPSLDPVLAIVPATGKAATVRALIRGGEDAAPLRTLLARPRHFAVGVDRRTGWTGPIHVRGTDGNDLLGSPLDPWFEQRNAIAATLAIRAHYPGGRGRAVGADAAGPASAIPADIRGPFPPIGSSQQRRPADVVIPVHGGGDRTRACLRAVLDAVEPPHRIVVVDDGTSDPDLRSELERMARNGRIRLLRHARTLGYIASANAGIGASAGRDIVLLNSDTLVPPQWLVRLRDAAYSAPDIGTVSPLSNNATILSYPNRDCANPMPNGVQTNRMAAQAFRANGAAVVEVPVAVGFCMYLRRDCINAVGLLRADVFAQGYGEENDFCLRARHLGWRHVAAPGVFVAHQGGASFGAAAAALRRRNDHLLERLHPGYADLIRAHLSEDPLASARRQFDKVRWQSARVQRRDAVLLITHRDGGGVERCVASSCAKHEASGRHPITLRPSSDPRSAPSVLLSRGIADDYPNLRFAVPSELKELARFLTVNLVSEIELHHLLGHDPHITQLLDQLGVPFDVFVHDYMLICPRVTLLGRERRYCGEPDLNGCEACIADLGSITGEKITVAAWRTRSSELLSKARKIFVPSADAARRIRHYFSHIDPIVRPHEADASLWLPPKASRSDRHFTRVCVVGAIGPEKGIEVLLTCARDAAERDLALEYVVVGHTTDDKRLLDTGRVFITGEYKPDEAVDLIRSQAASVAWLPSVWPETWCFALSECWQAGLPVVAFDLGAQAERVHRGGHGVVLPLGASPATINAALLAAACQLPSA
jgi:GT2 family glycosyltransferase/glycosyltransferase involved in cell wall biosynthesis